MTYPYGETVTHVYRVPSGDVDDDGNTVFTETSTTYKRVPVWPRDGNGTSSNELVQGQDTVIVGYSCLLPPGTETTAEDRVVWRGDRYEVDGQPGYLSSPFTGTKPGVALSLVRITG